MASKSRAVADKRIGKDFEESSCGRIEIFAYRDREHEMPHHDNHCPNRDSSDFQNTSLRRYLYVHQPGRWLF
jgi:hypothetical protein